MKSNNGVNDAGLSAKDRQLVNEIQEQIDKTNSTQLVCNYEIGRLIKEAYGEQKIYGSGQVERISEQVDKAPSTLYGYLGIAQDYTHADVQSLAYDKFSTPYKLLKAYKKLGRDVIMRVHEEAESLKDFKARLKACWLALKDPENHEHPEATVDPQTGEDDGDGEKGPDDTAAPDNENSPRGENSSAPEAEPSSAPVVPTTPDAEAIPAPDDAPELAPEGEGEDPQAPNYGDTKQVAGSAIEIAQPVNQKSGTPVEMLNANSNKDQTEPDDGLENITNAKTELERLRKENEDLKEERDKLLQENEGLKQLIETLQATVNPQKD